MQLRDTSAVAPDLAAGGERITCDLCVIGAGSGGLSVAAAAAAFGEKVVLIEKHKMGGDCLNYGCVPSKALLAAARRAHAIRTSGSFGIRTHFEPDIDHQAVHDHVMGVIDAIAPNDSVERFTGLGVRVIQAAGRFHDRQTVQAGEHLITARRFVVATGSSPLVPDIPGLRQVPFFTNETIFSNSERLPHLIIIGGGPIGLEMAQAHLRLGSRITVIEAHTPLGNDDPELSAVVLGALRDEGLDVREGAVIEAIEGRAGSVRVIVRRGGGTEAIEGTHLLVAAGRTPNLEGLSLEAGGIAYDGQGIKVDKALITSNKRVFAIGDCIGSPQFTHVANYHAGLVIRRALFRMPAKVDDGIIPWVTYTDPELAQVGLTEEQARKTRSRIRVLRWPLAENDRAQADRSTRGLVKVVTDSAGTILGAGIVGTGAGEIIQMWSLAVSQKLKIKAMTSWISPYPTYSEVNKRVAYRFYADAPASPAVRRIVGLLKVFG
ncbi:MAG: NAD(P)/FAD-dependent oxidoreductase [Hyphomicrobiaceae bacterium]